MTRWLIRFNKTGSTLIWKRQFFLGFIAIPWRYHGGTNIIRTPDCHEDTFTAAMEYINSQEKEADITVELQPV